ncbi:hypothetical protein [Paracoccus denitrificans]|jgi:hypothetical protein|uniref:Uncharacterized protein n=1 Tax=Paracoccus denitrificans (strain Pd 1222) TaxID=318586 RepID=A1B8H9_PARDP|nr:hypothetical protein [Paracoccus denitrificans]ABL71823.1 hypothetical protein Pden_3757 [Paracoccus denitrificans PD1222]MBB4628073.1 hypothetical protein [Paracoccus denitrificans]MCU7429140.1 hypothetical protein [Paracoccus denitrificans]QAR28412.1 hypothetical protein EO213_19095 [Paracoccus denitrificans]UPV96548.1 hypothetical protein M0K93_19185 [Paracoccus denitrificans]
MATTHNFTVGNSWTRIASGRADGQVVKVEGAGQFNLAVTVGAKSIPPDIPPQTGHRVTGKTDLPLVAAQHLWASAATPTNLTVT